MNAIRSLTGFESQCVVVSATFPAWQLDVSELSISTFLYGDESDLWGFEVHVNGTMTADDQARIRAIIEFMKPLEAKLAILKQGSISFQKVHFDVRAVVSQDQLVRFDLLEP